MIKTSAMEILLMLINQFNSLNLMSDVVVKEATGIRTASEAVAREVSVSNAGAVQG